MNHFLLNDCQEYIEETHQEVEIGYVLFGKDIYKILKQIEPEIFGKFRFYRATQLFNKTLGRS